VLSDIVMGADWGDFGRLRFGRRLGLLDTSPLEESIERHIAVPMIEELSRTFAALAWDVKAREPVLITSGPVASALRASSAVPGLFPPVRVGDRLLVDGILADNLPTWAARALGADVTIAVSVARREEPAPPGSASGRMWDVVRKYNGYPVTADDRPAEVLIKPRTAGLARWSPKDVPELVAAGRDAAAAALPEINAAVAAASDG
jgi:NTE family protein